MSYLIIELPLGIRYLITKLPIDMSYLVTQLLPSYELYLAALMFKVLYTLAAASCPAARPNFSSHCGVNGGLHSAFLPLSCSLDNSGYILYSTHSTVQYTTVYTI